MLQPCLLDTACWSLDTRLQGAEPGQGLNTPKVTPITYRMQMEAEMIVSGKYWSNK